METRVCAGCGIQFKVMITSLQKFHSQYCLDGHDGVIKIREKAKKHEPEIVVISDIKPKAKVDDWYGLGKPKRYR